MQELKDVSTLVTLVSELRTRFGARLWWRGEPSDYETRLVPGMLREDRDANEELSILIRFRQGAPSRRADVPADSDRAGWMFLMQHHGLPTRLLDWSENPLAALYFTVESDLNEPGVLWGVSQTGLNKSMTGAEALILPHHDDVARILRIAFRGDVTSDKILAVVPVENDLKTMLQAGRFTIHGPPDSVADRSDSKEYLTKWVVPAESKRAVKAQLDLLGIRRSTLFPDLTSLAADIGARRYKAPEDVGSDA